MAKAKNSSCRRVALISLLLAATSARSNAFVPSSLSRGTFTQSPSTVVAGPKASSPVRPATTGLRMGLDLVTYLRTEWISAALCTNQTPRSADVCLQLGTEDGRAGKLNFHFFVDWRGRQWLCFVSQIHIYTYFFNLLTFNLNAHIHSTKQRKRSDVHSQDDSHAHHIVC